MLKSLEEVHNPVSKSIKGLNSTTTWALPRKKLTPLKPVAVAIPKCHRFCPGLLTSSTTRQLIQLKRCISDLIQKTAITDMCVFLNVFLFILPTSMMGLVIVTSRQRKSVINKNGENKSNSRKKNRESVRGVGLDRSKTSVCWALMWTLNYYCIQVGGEREIAGRGARKAMCMFIGILPKYWRIRA